MGRKKQKEPENNYLPGCQIRKEELHSIVQEIENALDQRANINRNIQELYSHCESLGYSQKVLKEVIRMRMMDEVKRGLIDELLPDYMKVLDNINIANQDNLVKLAMS